MLQSIEATFPKSHIACGITQDQDTSLEAPKVVLWAQDHPP